MIDFHQTWYEYCSNGGYATFIFFRTLPSLILAWNTWGFLRWKWIVHGALVPLNVGCKILYDNRPQKYWTFIEIILFIQFEITWSYECDIWYGGRALTVYIFCIKNFCVLKYKSMAKMQNIEVTSNSFQ